MMPSSEPPGERVLPPTRRPDGTLRKPVRIRAGYVAQEEVAIYQPKGAQLRSSPPLVPPGYDPEDANKPKTKAAKKNEKRKEKRKQARSNASETGEPAEGDDTVDAVAERMESLTVEADEGGKMPAPDGAGGKMPTAGSKSEVEKRIRSLRKKIRLATESSTASEDKSAKLEAWRRELKELEESSGR